MTSLPDLEAWAIFARVAEFGSFSRTATELQLSKATVSKVLTRLEARLGTPLFHRSSRRLSLTESGRASLEHAQRILGEGEAAEDAANQSGEPRGTVRVAAPMSFGIQSLGPLLPGFMTRYPMVLIDLRLSDQRLDLIAEGVDLAVRIGTLPDSGLRARSLFPVHRPLVAAPAYIARHGSPRHPDDLVDHACIVFSHLTQPETWHFRHSTEGQISVRVTGRLRLDNADIALPALRAGLGIAQLPDFLTRAALQDGSLVHLLPDWTSQSGAVHLVTPPGLFRPARVAALIDYLVSELLPPPKSASGGAHRAFIPGE